MRRLVSILLIFGISAFCAGTADLLCSDEINLSFQVWYGLSLALYDMISMALIANEIMKEID